MSIKIAISGRDPPASEEERPRRLVGDALIRYYCIVHRTVAEDRAPVTIYQDSWAYCVSGSDGSHEWIPIEPISYADLRSFGPMFLDHVDGPLRPPEGVGGRNDRGARRRARADGAVVVRGRTAADHPEMGTGRRGPTS